jgi:hypothetical protein
VERQLKKIALLGLVALLFAGLIAGLIGCSEKEEAVELNVSAAASLTDVLKDTPNADSAGSPLRRIHFSGRQADGYPAERWADPG